MVMFLISTTPLTTDSEELYGPRTPRKEVMDHVLEDINKACDLFAGRLG